MNRVAKLGIIFLSAVLLATVSGCAEPTFGVSNLTVSPQEVKSGQSTTISVDITNPGGAEGTYTAILKIDGVQTDVQDVTVSPGANQQAIFIFTGEQVGTHSIDINGLTATLKVLKPLKPAEFRVESLVVSPSEVVKGKSNTVTVEVTNIGEVEGDYQVTLRVNDEVTETKKVTIAAGGTETVSFTLLEEQQGTYAVDVDGLSDTFTVKAPWTPPPPPPSPTPTPILEAGIKFEIRTAESEAQ